MSPKLQLYPDANWEQIYSGSWKSVILDDKYHRPIPAQEIPVLPEGGILACYCDSETAKDHWTYGGAFQQVYQVPTFSRGKLYAGRGGRVWLDQTTLVELPDRGSSYQLKFIPPKHLEDVSIILWQYTGPVTDSIEIALQRLRSDIADLKANGTIGSGLDGVGSPGDGARVNLGINLDFGGWSER
jgi:hypothetical protein